MGEAHHTKLDSKNAKVTDHTEDDTKDKDEVPATLEHFDVLLLGDHGINEEHEEVHKYHEESRDEHHDV